VYVEAFYETSDRPSTKAFVSAFREAHHEASITLLDAVGFDSGAMVRSVIEKNAPTTRAGFREILQHVKDFQGATGSLTMDDAREARRQLYLLNITTKGVKEVTPKRPEG
jgi:branched-chain amino acid transport system substrate-binding protein